VSYDSDLNHVENVTKEVIKETLNEMEGGIKDFEPIISFYSFGDSRTNLKAILRVTDYAAQFDVKSRFIKKLHQRYNKEGINIPNPVRTILLKKEEENM
jgi:small-conductance mechanosensitive channel